jgi:hypothetical protein
MLNELELNGDVRRRAEGAFDGVNLVVEVADVDADGAEVIGEFLGADAGLTQASLGGIKRA